MTMPLVSSQWLDTQIAHPEVKVVDATFYMPNQERDALAEYRAEHIPGAVFFDINEVCDHSNPLPHMLPSPADFAAAVGALGIGNGDQVVVYDANNSTMGAARVWWMFRAYGHERVSVLDGGLSAWKDHGGAVSDTPVQPAANTFIATLTDEARVVTAEDIVATLATRSAAIVDARAALRFIGEGVEPRPSLQLGHIPGARNIPFSNLLDLDTGLYLTPTELSEHFAEVGVELNKPMIVYCGSGVTSCAIAFAAYLVGKSDVFLYDGSWSEWGNRLDLPVQRGEAE